MEEKYKQKFIDYCKDKIVDFENVIIDDEEYYVCYVDSLCGFDNVRIICNDDTDFLLGIDENNNVVVNTPMQDHIGNLFDMTFSKINKWYYDNILLYWVDNFCDEYFED